MEREKERERETNVLGSSIMQTAERGGRNLLSCSGVLPSTRHFAGRWQMTKGGPAGAAGTAAPEKLAIERQRSVACRLRSTEKASVRLREFCLAAFWTLCDVGGGQSRCGWAVREGGAVWEGGAAWVRAGVWRLLTLF